MKKVIMILIDSLMPKDLEDAIKTGKTPLLKFLVENGFYNPKCVTAFPTMTASVDATLMTGVYPDGHKIPGLLWYNPKEKRIIDYINGAKTVFKLGLNETAEDVLVNLNDKHLNKNTKTIFEELSDNDKSSASINFIIHRGYDEKILKPPLLMNLFTKFSFNHRRIKGPNILSIGSVTKPNFARRKIPWNFNQSLIKRFGINDDFAIQVSKTTISSGNQPDFMAIYLPDHDHYLHKHIDQPLPSLEKVDKKLTKLFQVFGSWNEAIKNNIFIIIGDHGQTKIGKTQKNNIDLDQLLKGYNVVPLGEQVNDSHEVIFANNERMIYIYPLKKGKRRNIRETLLTEERIDFVCWKENEKVVIENSNSERMEFEKGGKYKDPYGAYWDINGDLGLLDIKIDKQNNITYNQYPDALSRLYGSLFSQGIFSIVISAKPNFEFISKTFPKHLGGGSHGSLHVTDSIVPMIITGATKKPKKDLRIVDLKDFILQSLNVNSTTTG